MGAGAARGVSGGYRALRPDAAATGAPDTAGASWTRFFPWEDWRAGRPEVIDEVIAPALRRWAKGSDERLARARLLFALDGARWNEERVLDRYELLYESRLVAEAARDRGAGGDTPAGLGETMISDHRRILATGLGRLRGKLRYRPVAFDLMPAEFTLWPCKGRSRRSLASPCTNRTSGADWIGPVWLRGWAVLTARRAAGRRSFTVSAASNWAQARRWALRCHCSGKAKARTKRARLRSGGAPDFVSKVARAYGAGAAAAPNLCT